REDLEFPIRPDRSRCRGASVASEKWFPEAELRPPETRRRDSPAARSREESSRGVRFREERAARRCLPVRPVALARLRGRAFSPVGGAWGQWWLRRGWMASRWTEYLAVRAR